MRPEVDRMLSQHVQRNPGASLSWTVNEALVEYFESAALHAYRRWDTDAADDERVALEALRFQDDRSWAVE